jgi:hypothetical protein
MKSALLILTVCCMLQSLSAQVVKFKTTSDKFVDISNNSLFIIDNADGKAIPWKVAGFREEGILLKYKNENQVLSYDGRANFGLSPLSTRQFYAKKRAGIFLASFGGILVASGVASWVGATINLNKPSDREDIVLPLAGRVFGGFFMVIGGGISLGSLPPLLRVRAAKQRPIRHDGGSFYVY